jgi:hypothetical protein
VRIMRNWQSNKPQANHAEHGRHGWQTNGQTIGTIGARSQQR